MIYKPHEYLFDRAGIIREIEAFIARYPRHSLADTTFPARLDAIAKEYRAQFKISD